MKIKPLAKAKKAKRRSVQLSGFLIDLAAVSSKVEDRSIAKQIEHWAKLGKCAEENDGLPLSLIKEMLLSMEQLDAGQGSEYEFE